MQLIIAEKPAVAMALKNAIPGAENKEDGYIQKGGYTITWAMGHLLDLKEPKDYNISYKTWSLEQLPIYFPDWQLKPRGKSRGVSQLNIIGNLLKRADSVIHAGDPDDEGQLLIDEILRWFHYRGPVYRINTNDTTEPALRSALQQLRDNRECESTGWAAHARRVADMIVGCNCSRYFTLKNPDTLLSVGRVQTATLGLVVLRDQTIERHQKQKYYTICADLAIAGQVVRTTYEPPKDDPHLDNGRVLQEQYAKELVGYLGEISAVQAKIEYTEELEQPPLPFNLTELQTYCSKKFSFDPSKVLALTQSLRDDHDAITYNRSDCQYLSESQYEERNETMEQVMNNIAFHPKGMDMTIHSRCFDNSNLTAHTAIIPQNKPVDLKRLSEEERHVYLAICKYYMAQFYPPAKKGKTRLDVLLPNGGRLVASSTAILEQGYRYLFRNDKLPNETTTLSGIAAGEYTANVVTAGYEGKETKPPARYTKAGLAKDMTRIARYVQNQEVRNLLLKKDRGKKGENGSIGTVATRASTIDLLCDRGYLEQKSKQLVSTPLGRELYRILPDELKKPDMTAYWWAMQEDIQAGKRPWTDLTESVLKMVDGVVHTDYPSVDMTQIPDRLHRKKSGSGGIGACPRCGGEIKASQKSFYCSNYKNGCKFSLWKKSKMHMLEKTTFSENDMRKFLAGEGVRKTNLLKKDGSTFSGTLIMVDDPNSPYGPKIDLKLTGKRKERK